MSNSNNTVPNKDEPSNSEVNITEANNAETSNIEPNSAETHNAESSNNDANHTVLELTTEQLTQLDQLVLVVVAEDVDEQTTEQVANDTAKNDSAKNDSAKSGSAKNDSAKSDNAKLAKELVTQMGLTPTVVARSLADLAFQRAESEMPRASHWVAIASALLAGTENHPIQAQIAFTQARLQMMQGDFVAAEASLCQAQTEWQAAGDEASRVRGFMGLTQILTILGRYDEAETAIREVITYNEQLVTDAESNSQAVSPELILNLARARSNLSSIFSYQDQHQNSLDELAQTDQYLQTYDELFDEETRSAATSIHASVKTNEAVGLMSLDAPLPAETSLQEALSLYDTLQDILNRARTHSNLGWLYGQTGQYARALQAFEQANNDFATHEPIHDDEPLRPQDHINRLKQSYVYLALNLFQETYEALAYCEPIFRESQQPYELGQTLYTRGIADLNNQNYTAATEALTDAQAIFNDIQNTYWHNRTQLALAILAYRNAQIEEATVLVTQLIASVEQGDHWDLESTVELKLLQLRLHVDDGQLDEARATATHIHDIIEPARPNDTGEDNIDEEDTDEANQLVAESDQVSPDLLAYPHLQLRLQHALGRIERAAGNHEQARVHFLRAIALLESQRASFSLEEIRTAYLDDKTQIYSDLVLSLLDAAAPKPDNEAELTEQAEEISKDGESDDGSTDSAIAEAFAIIERARSRALLERLMAAIPEDELPEDELPEDELTEPDTDTDEGQSGERTPQSDLAKRRTEARAQLHWLYNRLLSEEGSRQVDLDLNEEIRTQEAFLQQLEWQASPIFMQAQPVDLGTLQATLNEPTSLERSSNHPIADEQVMAFYIAGNEVLAFLIDRRTVRVYRNLCHVSELRDAISEVQFQLGRAEMGVEYVKRHNRRLQRALKTALHHLYQLLIEPLAQHLYAARLQLIPHGVLHQVPFHALWDGEQYLINRFECRYAPSASIAVHCRALSQTGLHFAQELVFAGLAITDPTIPQARIEAETVTRHFTESNLYLDDAASQEGLRAAAAQADILHIATHGLFRADNPFFSALKLADGWMDVREIYRLTLRAQLVVLSACESGAGTVQGADELIGLARGFLGAGVRSLLVSLWNVHDASAAQLMDVFYHALVYSNDRDEQKTDPNQTTHPATALRTAQLEAIEAEQHPYFWAPFFVIG
ncbi:MAG: CHAT domain-containing protein [Chloroflexota bacterium]